MYYFQIAFAEISSVNGFIEKFYWQMGLLGGFISKWVYLEILLVNGFIGKFIGIRFYWEILLVYGFIGTFYW